MEVENLGMVRLPQERNLKKFCAKIFASALETDTKMRENVLLFLRLNC